MLYHVGGQNIKQNRVKCHSASTDIKNYLECDNCGKNFHNKSYSVRGVNITKAVVSWICDDCKLIANNSNTCEAQKRKAPFSPTYVKCKNDNNYKRILKHPLAPSSLSDNTNHFDFDKLAALLQSSECEI